MRPVAERSVCRVFAITKLVVPTLIYVELNRSATSHSSVTCSVTIGVLETQPTRAPVVNFALLQIGIIREETFINFELPVMKGTLGGRYLPSL